MIMKRLLPGQLGRIDLVPRAMLRHSVDAFRDRAGVSFDRDADDLDSFSAAWFEMGPLTFGLMHHDQEPDDRMSIYLPRCLSQREAHNAVLEIMHNFDLSPQTLIWEETEIVQMQSA